MDKYQEIAYSCLESSLNLDKTICRQGCEAINYEGSPRTILNEDENGSTSLTIEFASMDVEVREELLIFDFNAIVSAVGGSLGLFLGFSFYDLYIWVLDIIWDWCCIKKLNKQSAATP